MGAILTLYFSERNYNSWDRKAYDCSLLKWCHVAHNYSLSYNFDVIVLTNDISKVKLDCPKARAVLFDKHLLHEISIFRKRHSHIKYSVLSVKGMMMKWQIVNMIQYKSVLYTDIDVDISDYINFDRLQFEEHIHKFENNKKCYLKATRDSTSPVNGGILLIKPSSKIYNYGLKLLQHNFSIEYGFMNSGSIQSHNWDFLDAANDQGMFSFVHIKVFRSLCKPVTSMRIRHYWGPYKPWKWRDCLPYYNFLNDRNVPRSPCYFTMLSEQNETKVDHCKRKGRESGVMWPVV